MPVYKKGSIASANVTDIKPYGVFVSLEHKYSGLIHISEIANGYVKNINDYINIGDTLNVKILDVDEQKHQLKLSTKETLSSSLQLGIKETKYGFQTLKNNLNFWIDEKLLEIDKNSK